MIHLISTIVGYVGGDISTPFARDNLSRMSGGPIANPDFPMCLLIEKKEMYTESAILSRKLFRNAYFSEELLNRMFEHLRWSDVFISPGVPPEFALKHKDKDVAFWNYPRIPLDIIREEAKTTVSEEICKCIMSNPSIFSKGVEEAEKIIETINSRSIISEISMIIFVSCNIAAPLEFFTRNPRYIYWEGITCNHGRVLRGDVKKTIAFLDEGFDGWGADSRRNICSNPAVPAAFIKKHLSKLGEERIWDLAHNPSISVSFWNKNVKIAITGQILLGFAGKQSTPYSFVAENLLRCSQGDRKRLIQSSYNVPVSEILKMAKEKPEEIDWGCIAANRGFWIHLAEKDLTPVLTSVLP